MWHIRETSVFSVFNVECGTAYCTMHSSFPHKPVKREGQISNKHQCNTLHKPLSPPKTGCPFHFVKDQTGSPTPLNTSLLLTLCTVYNTDSNCFQRARLWWGMTGLKAGQIFFHHNVSNTHPNIYPTDLNFAKFSSLASLGQVGCKKCSTWKHKVKLNVLHI